MIVGFDTTVFPKLDYKDPEAFHSTIEEIKEFFEREAGCMDEVRKKAALFRKAFNKLDPFIQRYTAKVCPYCGTVCCANKHGFPEFADVAGFLAMGLEVPSYNLEVDEADICQFIGPSGCILPRPQRPYRCTWYFCEPLLLQIEIGPARHYRNFIADVQELGAARGNLMRLLYQLWTSREERSGP